MRRAFAVLLVVTAFAGGATAQSLLMDRGQDAPGWSLGITNNNSSASLAGGFTVASRGAYDAALYVGRIWPKGSRDEGVWAYGASIDVFVIRPNHRAIPLALSVGAGFEIADRGRGVVRMGSMSLNFHRTLLDAKSSVVQASVGVGRAMVLSGLPEDEWHDIFRAGLVVAMAANKPASFVLNVSGTRMDQMWTVGLNVGMYFLH